MLPRSEPGGAQGAGVRDKEPYSEACSSCCARAGDPKLDKWSVFNIARIVVEPAGCSFEIIDLKPASLVAEELRFLQLGMEPADVN